MLMANVWNGQVLDPGVEAHTCPLELLLIDLSLAFSDGGHRIGLRA